MFCTIFIHGSLEAGVNVTVQELQIDIVPSAGGELIARVFTVDDLEGTSDLVQTYVARILRGFQDNLDALDQTVIHYSPEECAHTVRQQKRVPTGKGCPGRGWGLTRPGEEEDTYTREVIIDRAAAERAAQEKKQFAQDCRQRMEALGLAPDLITQVIKESGPQIADEAVRWAYQVTPKRSLLAVLLASALRAENPLDGGAARRISLTLTACCRGQVEVVPVGNEALAKFVRAAHIALADRMTKES